VGPVGVRQRRCRHRVGAAGGAVVDRDRLAGAVVVAVAPVRLGGGAVVVEAGNCHELVERAVASGLGVDTE